MTDSANPESPSLYDRIGGAETIDNLIGSFYDSIFADPELAPFFDGVAKEKLVHMQREFFAAALGGPIPYSGRSLAHVHHGKGIKIKHVQRFVRHLFSTLENFPISKDDKNEIISRINRHVDDIVGGAGLDA